MPGTVTLSIAAGPLVGQAFVFDHRTTCVLGRAADCDPRLPDDDQHQTISRHHCLIDINPPDARVRDFGSLNGTFVNGAKIGQRRPDQTPEQGAAAPACEHDLQDGDEIGLGGTVLRVGVVVPRVCASCGEELPAGGATAFEPAPGVLVCEACRCRPPRETALHVDGFRSCAQCGRDVTGEHGRDRPGAYVCAGCRANPTDVLRRLLELGKSHDPRAGAIGHYEILDELGRGGMATVYRARDTRTGREVALKVLLPRVAADPRGAERFLREVANTRVLRHRHVVELYDETCTDGAFVFAMEFCPGGSADQLRQSRGGRLDPDAAVEITLQVLDALAYAHGVELPHSGGRVTRGLVHRDLKPANVFLADAGRHPVVKVGDFGLAKAFDEAGLGGLTRTGTVGGTPYFMCRQQVINFKCARPEVDVWAAAASLYALVTGHAPRDFPEAKDWWQVVLSADPVPARRRRPELPRRLAELLDAALIDRPDLHFKTATEFRAALLAAV